MGVGAICGEAFLDENGLADKWFEDAGHADGCGDDELEAEALPPEGRTRREIYRHIGDFTLFWTGVYPEALKRRRSAMTRDQFLDY